MKKLTFTLLFALMAIVSAQAAKVYLKIGEGRVTAESNIAVWAWNGDNNFCTNKDWPGDKLTEKETIGTTDYFVYTVNTEGSYNLIFNNNDKSNNEETATIKDLTGDYTFVLNNEWDGENWSCTKTEGAPKVETYNVQLWGNAYGTWNAPVTFTYNAETGEYVYEETVPTKLADEFKIDIPETSKWFKRDDLVNKNLSEASSDFVAMNDNSGDMKITDAASYSKITLIVKNDNGTWMLKVVGVKKETPVETYTVQIKGVNYDNWGVNAPAFNYNAETGEYVYEETETAKLADMFKIYVKEGDRWISNASFKGALNNDLGYQDLNEGDVMNITDAADYSKITLTVKNDNGTWKLKVVGEKTDKVQITGKFNGWAVADMKLDNNTYSIEIEEGIEDLTYGDDSTTDYGFCILINGVYYGGKKTITLGGDAETMVANPNHGDNLKIDNTADFKVVHLFVKKVDDNWTISAKGSHTSSVAGVDAAGVVIAAANGEIVVDGAQSVAVYTTAGALVSTDARTRVAAGLYIVRADNVVKKVIVK